MNQFLKVAAMTACLLPLGACSSSDEEPQMERKITVTCYESIAPKGNTSYAPKEWSYTTTMLFNCQPSDIDKAASTATLANGVATLTDGEAIAARYKSNTGVIIDADYNSYTLVIYCNNNPYNAYLENRWTCKQFHYSESNSVASLSCCFVWENMAVSGGWCEWVNP